MSGFVIEDGVLTKYTGPGGDVVIPEGVTEIGGHAFFDCKNLSAVTFGSDVVRIGDNAFSACHGLESLVLPEGVEKIGSCAFSACIGLKQAVLPESLREIGYWAFMGCRSLQRVVLPCGPAVVNYLNQDMFLACESLSCLVSPAIPVSTYQKPKMKLAAAMGFLTEPRTGQDPVIAAEYRKYAVSQRKRLLPTIFRMDCVEALDFYAGIHKITAANFEQDYLSPALEAGAGQCAAYLLEWSAGHIDRTPDGGWKL